MVSQPSQVKLEPTSSWNLELPLAAKVRHSSPLRLTNRHPGEYSRRPTSMRNLLAKIRCFFPGFQHWRPFCPCGTHFMTGRWHRSLRKNSQRCHGQRSAWRKHTLMHFAAELRWWSKGRRCLWTIKQGGVWGTKAQPTRINWSPHNDQFFPFFCAT